MSPVQKTTGAKGRCDRLWAEVVKIANYCISCGSTDRLHAHHLVSRRYNRTRHLLENGVPLCFTCHSRFHDNPVFATQIIKESIGLERYEQLRLMAIGPCRMREADWARIADELKAERDRLKQILDQPPNTYPKAAW